MNWIGIVKALLSIAAYIVNKRSDAEQQQIGADRVIQKSLMELALRTRVAKEVRKNSEQWSDDDINRILQSYYRDDDEHGTEGDT